MSGKSLRKRKLQGGLSIELSLSIVMILALLFVCLSMFGAQLISMARNGSLQRMFFGLDRKVAFNINRNMNNRSETLVQITGQQGLSWYADEAEKKLEEYSALSQQDMTSAVLEDMAKWATVLKIADAAKYDNYETSIEQNSVSVNIDRGLTLYENGNLRYAMITNKTENSNKIDIIKGIL